MPVYVQLVEKLDRELNNEQKARVLEQTRENVAHYSFDTIVVITEQCEFNESLGVRGRELQDEYDKYVKDWDNVSLFHDKLMARQRLQRLHHDVRREAMEACGQTYEHSHRLVGHERQPIRLKDMTPKARDAMRYLGQGCKESLEAIKERNPGYMILTFIMFLVLCYVINHLSLYTGATVWPAAQQVVQQLGHIPHVLAVSVFGLDGIAHANQSVFGLLRNYQQMGLAGVVVIGTMIYAITKWIQTRKTTFASTRGMMVNLVMTIAMLAIVGTITLPSLHTGSIPLEEQARIIDGQQLQEMNDAALVIGETPQMAQTIDLSASVANLIQDSMKHGSYKAAEAYFSGFNLEVVDNVEQHELVVHALQKESFERRLWSRAIVESRPNPLLGARLTDRVVRSAMLVAGGVVSAGTSAGLVAVGASTGAAVVPAVYLAYMVGVTKMLPVKSLLAAYKSAKEVPLLGVTIRNVDSKRIIEDFLENAVLAEVAADTTVDVASEAVTGYARYKLQGTYKQDKTEREFPHRKNLWQGKSTTRRNTETAMKIARDAAMIGADIAHKLFLGLMGKSAF